jgi:hypothetical protein
MRKMTFQIGSEFKASERRDPWFERAIDQVRNAFSPPAPVLVPVRGSRKPTRYQARLAALSRES